MLDEEHPVLPAADPHDANSYLLGRMGDHNVVIACLPAETTGKVSAATVATDLIRSFPSIRFGLMVGIGGGVPSYHGSPRQAMTGGTEEGDLDDSEDETEEIPDVRLGDVVVSLHTKITEAVVQYDFGKSLQAKGFVHAGGRLSKPPNIVLNAVARLQADHARGHHKIPELLSKMFAKNPAMTKFQHPGSKKDRLFKPDFFHQEGQKSCKACCGPNNANIVKRTDRTDTAPKIHYGTIGSADQVMEDAILRDQWAMKDNILCFEMEAAGLMDAFPCLVIRGICDYSDSHKSKLWQPYAAATAAAYAKELLLVIPGQGLAKLSPIKQLLHLSEQIETVNSTLEKTFAQRENHHHEQIMRYATEDQRRCHQSFKTSTYEKYKNNNPKRIEKTCAWVLDSEEYQQWWNAPRNDLLWISADPGCGKSVLARSLIDDIFRSYDPNISIVYFFFKDNDEQNQLSTALCAVLHQLFSNQRQLLQYALPSWESNGEKLTHETEDLWRVFMEATTAPMAGKTICVLDALDECRVHDRGELIDKLRHFHAQYRSDKQNWLKFLATSRPYDDIKDRFQPITETSPKLHLRGENKNDQINKEINHVVKIRVDELSKKLKLKSKTQLSLQQELLQMEHRTYLWLHLAIDDIHTTFRDSLQPDQVSINKIPRTVDAAYEKILDRVTPEQEATVRTILHVIIGARRPLHIQEMAMALAVDSSCEGIAKDSEISLRILGEKIRRLCGLFIFIKDSRVYLIHQTAREFLIRRVERPSSLKWYLEPNETEVRMTQICVRYLLMDDLVNDGGHARDLLEYSSQNWADHFRAILLPVTELSKKAYQLYDTTNARFDLWFPIFWEAAMPHKQQPKMHALHLAALNGHHGIIPWLLLDSSTAINIQDNSRTNALQYACFGGHCECVQALLERGADVNAQGGEYGNPLYIASEEGNLNIVKVLLQNGADVNAWDKRFGTALCIASKKGHVQIVELLMESGANVNAKGREYENALYVASQEEHLDVVKILVEKGADVNSWGGHYGNALHAATEKGYLDIVKILLEKGAGIDAQGGKYGNALQTASIRGHLHIVEVLLEKGANVDAQGGGYGNALQAASIRGHIHIVKALLGKGADVNAQGGEYGNALQAASFGGHIFTTKVLLKQGADVNWQGGEYGSALQAASIGGYIHTVKVLLKHGADVDAQGGYYGNALQAASIRGHLHVVNALLEKGANINAQCGQYGNALQAASIRGHLHAVNALLEKGANIDAQGGEYGNALQAAFMGGYHHIVEILLKKGANIDAQGGKYGNVLQAASLGGHLHIVKVLLGKGADVNAQGGKYGNALQAASLEGHLHIVKVLLGKGADVNAQGGKYGNALQAASLEGHLHILKVLLGKGADVNAQGGEYGNALSAAIIGRHFDIVELLLEKGANGKLLLEGGSV
ncbi:hypothetical protein ZTR_10658 [Talaromyces verruculosus]|nr:hypothetical protein ZTR_10658 [Talaromyces verruculosus]